jgi:hypothetical protein
MLDRLTFEYRSGMSELLRRGLAVLRPAHADHFASCAAR